MCGICGKINLNDGLVDEALLKRRFPVFPQDKT